MFNGKDKHSFLNKRCNFIIYYKEKKFECDPWVFCLCGNTSEPQVHLGSS